MEKPAMRPPFKARFTPCARAALLVLGITLPAAAQTAPTASREHAPYILRDGSIQIVTAAPLASAIRALNAVFLSTRPGIKFTVLAGDNYSAMAALTFDRSLVAPMGSEYTRIGLGDNLKIAAEPLGLRIAHASLTPGPAVPALGVIVNAANPLTTLSMVQVTRLFTIGAPGGDIATWSQAGVSGPLGDRAVHPIGPFTSDYQDSGDPQVGEFLATDKFGGLNMNHQYLPLAHYADVIERVNEDRAAIGITALNLPLGQAKVIALKTDTGSPSAGSAADIAAGKYPLDRFVYLYLRVGKGQPLDAFAAEYARFVLSPEGQRVLAADPSGYLPLSPGELAEERAKLDR